MDVTKKIENVIRQVKTHFKNEHLYEDVSYTSFLLSLLPIPGVELNLPSGCSFRHYRKI